MGDFFNSLLLPLEWVVAWIMVGAHSVLVTLGMDPAGGWTWVLAIVALVLVIRTALIPLFMRQIRASRQMQVIQPEIKKIQDKYKGKKDQASREAMTKETMELYKSSKTNPFASCLPILLQLPIFFALFRVLNGIQNESFSVGPFTSELRAQADAATIFGASLSDTFTRADTTATQIIAVVLIVAMSGSQYWVQRMLMTKNMPPTAMDSPFFQQQKILLYVLPVVFAITGVNFPIGVLIYWFVTNIFSAAQQFIVIRSMPAPGSEAEKELAARKKRKAERRARRRGGAAPDTDPAASAASTGLNGSAVEDGGADEGVKPQRVQPKRQSRSKRRAKAS